MLAVAVIASRRLVAPAPHLHARIARIGLRRRALEVGGDAARDLDDGRRPTDTDRADVASFDLAATAHHRDEAARLGAMRLSPRDAEGDPLARRFTFAASTRSALVVTSTVVTAVLLPSRRACASCAALERRVDHGHLARLCAGTAEGE